MAIGPLSRQANPATVSAVVVTYRSREHVDRCLESLRANGVQRIWVVDNASDDGTADHVSKRFPDVDLIRNKENLGFAAANNQALRLVETPFALLLNPDAWLEPDAIRHMLASMCADERVGVLGPRIMRGGEIEPSLLMAPRFRDALMFLASGMRAFGTGGFSGRTAAGYPWDEGGEGDHVRGSCMMVRMAAVRDAGYLDECFFLYFEETEWCLRLRRAGWSVRIVPAAVVHHLGKASVRTEEQLPSIEYMRSAILFWRKEYGTWRARLLQAILLGMASVKWILLAIFRGSSAKRAWLHDVTQLARNPYSVPIPYPGARRPSCWMGEQDGA